MVGKYLAIIQPFSALQRKILFRARLPTYCVRQWRNAGVKDLGGNDLRRLRGPLPPLPPPLNYKDNRVLAASKMSGFSLWARSVEHTSQAATSSRTSVALLQKRLAAWKTLLRAPAGSQPECTHCILPACARIASCVSLLLHGRKALHDRSCLAAPPIWPANSAVGTLNAARSSKEHRLIVSY